MRGHALRGGRAAALVPALALGALAATTPAAAVGLALALGLVLLLFLDAAALAQLAAVAVAVEAFAAANGWQSAHLVELAAAGLLACALVARGPAVAGTLAAAAALVLWMLAAS